MNDPTLFDQDADTTRVYGGTSGWSGSDTSRDRAAGLDARGVTARVDARTRQLLTDTGPHGMTWRELAAHEGIHHGEASGSLSRLHLVDAIARLTERRDRCAVYVALQHVNDRPTGAYTPNVTRRVLTDVLEQLDERLAAGDVGGARRIIAVAKTQYS